MRLVVPVLVASLSVGGCVSEAARQAKEDEALIAASRAAEGAHPASGHRSFSRSTVVRHFGVVGLQTVFWLPNSPISLTA